MTLWLSSRQFPSYFAEWNDRFRDDLCRFWLWKSGEIGAFAERFAGSEAIYLRKMTACHILHLILLPLTMVLRLKI